MFSTIGFQLGQAESVNFSRVNLDALVVPVIIIDEVTKPRGIDDG
jgi:hypothetical protein